MHALGIGYINGSNRWLGQQLEVWTWRLAVETHRAEVELEAPKMVAVSTFNRYTAMPSV